MLDFIDIFLHLDSYLGSIIQEYGIWTYAILFIIIFLETGIVVTPFLPGDSLIFIAATFAGIGVLNPLWLFLIVAAAAILGDTVNYWIGYNVGPRVFPKKSRYFKMEYLERAQKFFKKHGPKTIVIARFLPIIRTFAPFVAGISKMDYKRFLTYNVLGGVFWVGLFVSLGYFFGNMPIVRENFTAVIVIIILASLIPPGYDYIQHRRKKAIEK